MNARLTFRATVFASFIVAASTAVAEDFRVDSRVYIGKETTPHNSNTTFFQGAHVYDFLDQPEQITIYDLGRERFVLMDTDRKVRTEITGEMITAFCKSLRVVEAKHNDPLLRFALAPTFDEKEQKDDGPRVFESKFITYRVNASKPEDPTMAARYREFSDWSAKLNSLVNRGSLPPFPRLTLNTSLAKSGQVPDKLQVSLSPRSFLPGRGVTFRSEHEFRPRLLDSDLKKIEHAGELLTSTKRVGLGEYLRTPIDGHASR
jgi:hypothetical protein